MEFHPAHHCKQFFCRLALEIKIHHIPMVKSSLPPFCRCSCTISFCRSVYPVFFRDRSRCPILRCLIPFFLHTLLNSRFLLYRFSKSFHNFHKLLISCLTGSSIKHFQIAAVHHYSRIVRGIAVKTHIHSQPSRKPKGLFFKA